MKSPIQTGDRPQLCGNSGSVAGRRGCGAIEKESPGSPNCGLGPPGIPGPERGIWKVSNRSDHRLDLILGFVKSLEKLYGEIHDELDLILFLPDRYALHQLGQFLMLRALLDSISRREALVLRLRYGLDDDRPLTLEQIGRRVKLTRERVRQIEREAIQKLSNIITSRLRTRA